MLRFHEHDRPSFIDLAKIVVTKNVGQTQDLTNQELKKDSKVKGRKESLQI